LNDIYHEVATRPKRSNHKLINKIVFSLLFHVGVIVLVVLNMPAPSTVENVESANIVEVKSYLRFKNTHATSPIIDVAINDKILPGDSTKQVSTNINKTSNIVPKQITKKETYAPEVQEVAKQVIQTFRKIKPKAESTDNKPNNSIDLVKSRKPLIDIRKQTLTTLSHKSHAVTDLSVDTINSLNLNAFEMMLQEETESFNKLKDSPIIDTMGKLDTIGQPTELSPTVVNCGGVVSKTFAVMSSLTGGNVQCKQYEIQSFINKRLYQESDEK